MTKRTVAILAMVWIGIVVAVVTAAVTVAFMGNGVVIAGTADAAEQGTEKRYARLEEVRRMLTDDYYQEVDEDALMQGAIDGMMASLDDPYTFYYTADELKSERETQTGTYIGVGMQVTLSDGRLLLLRVFEGSPAEKSGLRAEDFLLAVDGTAVKGETMEDLYAATALIRGDAGTNVTLTMERAGEPYDVVLTRGAVSIDYGAYRILDGNIGYVVLYEFMGNAQEKFAEAVSAFEAAGVKGMIIDLRANPGGLLTEVVNIADAVLPEGLVTYTEARDGARENFYSKAERFDVPLVVLVDGNSASASEILAAAVQDYGVGTIVGETTFGKGIVQTMYSFADEEGLQMTTSAYYTPKGRSIHGEGVVPDVVVTLAEDAEVSTLQRVCDPAVDAQLKKALEILAAQSK